MGIISISITTYLYEVIPTHYIFLFISFILVVPHTFIHMNSSTLKHAGCNPLMNSISQEIWTRFLLCCALLWLYIDWFSISIRLTSLALWQSNDCPSASKATLMNMDKYFMWIHYERLHNHNKAKHNKTVCIFLGIYCTVCNVLNMLQIFSSWSDSFKDNFISVVLVPYTQTL